MGTTSFKSEKTFFIPVVLSKKSSIHIYIFMVLMLVRSGTEMNGGNLTGLLEVRSLPNATYF